MRWNPRRRSRPWPLPEVRAVRARRRQGHLASADDAAKDPMFRSGPARTAPGPNASSSTPKRRPSRPPVDSRSTGPECCGDGHHRRGPRRGRRGDPRLHRHPRDVPVADAARTEVRSGRRRPSPTNPRRSRRTRVCTTGSSSRASSGGFSRRIRSGSRSRIFFLGCVIVAGLYGAATVSRRILVRPGACRPRSRSRWPSSRLARAPERRPGLSGPVSGIGAHVCASSKPPIGA